MTIEDLPEVEFINVNIDELIKNMVLEYEDAYYAETGIRKKLEDGSKIKIWINAQALRIYQTYKLMNYLVKQNYLKYAEGKYLDNWATRYKGISRIQAKKAITQVKFTLTTELDSDLVIPEGTKITAGDNVYFATTGRLIITANTLEGIMKAECVEEGKKGNGYKPGELNIIVDPIAYVGSVENLSETYGGEDLENDEHFRDRLLLAPEGYSTAGSAEAYKFSCLNFSTEISDIKVFSDIPGEVKITVLLNEGELPNEEFIKELSDYVEKGDIKPLTDLVKVESPTVIEYDIDLKYFINDSDIYKEKTLKQQIEAAIDNYILWQKDSIGKDINVSYLISKMMEAGAKRVEVNFPVFTKVNDTSVAILKNKNVVYGGLESD